MRMQAPVEMAEPIETPHQKIISVSPVDVFLSAEKTGFCPCHSYIQTTLLVNDKGVENLTYHPATSFTVEVKLFWDHETST